MSAPVVPVPQGGQVLSRPRKEGLYDTEAFVAATNTPTAGTVTQFPFYLNTRQFADAAAGNKTAGLDTNLVSNGGSIPRGHYLRVFGVQIYITRRGTQNLTAAALDDKRKLIDTAFWQLNLGSTPYMQVPFNKIPAGTGMTGQVSTTENNLTIGEWQNAVANCFCMYDLTVPGKVNVPDKKNPGQMKSVRVPRIPIEFAETESFTAVLTFPTRPVIAINTTLFLQHNFVFAERPAAKMAA